MPPCRSSIGTHNEFESHFPVRQVDYPFFGQFSISVSFFCFIELFFGRIGSIFGPLFPLGCRMVDIDGDVAFGLGFGFSQVDEWFDEVLVQEPGGAYDDFHMVSLQGMLGVIGCRNPHAVHIGNKSRSEELSA